MSEWDEDAERDNRVPKIVREHMVVVLDKSGNRRGFVKVVTVTSTQAANVDTDLFIPIAPCPKRHKKDTQLHIANVGLGWNNLPLYRLPKRSYVRLDQVYDVPFDVLEPYLWSQSEHVALRQQSYIFLMHVMGKRPKNPMNISAE